MECWPKDHRQQRKKRPQNQSREAKGSLKGILGRIVGFFFFQSALTGLSLNGHVIVIKEHAA